VLGHEVRIEVVVGHRILVGPVTPSMAELTCVSWWPSERQAGRLGQHLETHLSLEALVPGDLDVADHGVGDVCADVEGGGPRRQYPSTRPR